MWLRKFFIVLIGIACFVLPLSWAESPSKFTGHAQVGKVRTVVIPADTVMNVALNKTISTRQSELGEEVLATVKDPVFVGPYLVVPENSTLYGSVVEINKKAQKKGPNPYIILEFNQLKRLGEVSGYPFNASLIIYKTGLRRGDYLWRLPDPQSRWRNRIGSTIEGAVAGLFVNPVIGPLVGGGAGALKAVAIEKIAQKGSVKIKSGEAIPLAVQESVEMPIIRDGKRLAQRYL